MSDKKLRVLLYPLVLLVLSGLVYGGFVYRVDPDVDTLVNSAEILAQTGCFGEAMDYAERALAQDPHHRYAHILMGYACGELSQDDRSIAHYEEALRWTAVDDEQLALLQLYLAEALVRGKRWEEGIEVARKVQAKDPSQMQAWFVVGKARAAQERFEEAEEAFRRAHTQAPSDPEPLFLLSDLAERQGRLDRALTLLAEAEALRPEAPAVCLRRARVLASRGEKEGAVQELLTVAQTHRVLMKRFLLSEEALEELREDPRLLAEMN